MRRRPAYLVVGLALAGVFAATAVGSSGRAAGAKPLSVKSCSAIQNPSGNLLIASDLPLQGAGRSQTVEMAKAIAFYFAQNNWMAGAYTLAYQSCDDSSPYGYWDSGMVAKNAFAFAANSSVVGVIGTFNSGAAEIMIPVINQAAGGPIPMLSPANTYAGLTSKSYGTAVGEPDKYYPTGVRNYARLVPPDQYQGTADALLAQKLHTKRVYVLSDRQAYGGGVASSFSHAAKKYGLRVTGSGAFSPVASSYARLAAKIKASHAQAVFVGGLICENGVKLIKDIRKANPRIQFILPDGFTPISALISGAGAAAAGATVSVGGVDLNHLPSSGNAFVAAFAKANGGRTPGPYAIYAAQAAQVFVQAIAASDGTRLDINAKLRATNIPDGLLGPVSFNASGDPARPVFTIYRVKGGKIVTYKIITP